MDKMQGVAQWDTGLASPGQGSLLAPHPAGRSGWQMQRPHPAWTGRPAWKREVMLGTEVCTEPRVSPSPWA